MERGLLAKIVLLKQEVEAVKQAPILQRANRAEAVISKAIFIIEELATNQVEMEKMLGNISEGVQVDGK